VPERCAPRPSRSTHPRRLTSPSTTTSCCASWGGSPRSTGR
jgi:hypothetical protein